MAKLPSITKIKEALEKMDLQILSKNKLESLNKIFITNEELSEFNSEENSNAKWDKCETFLIELYNIKNSKEKLKIWEIINNFNENYDLLNNQLNYYNLSCDEIKESKILNESLNYILTIGNIMNADSNTTGQADGFNLDLLNKINDVKDNNGKSFLFFVVLCLKKNKIFDENVIKKDNIKLASENLNAEVNNNLNNLKKNLSLIENNLNKIKNDSSEFIQKSKKYFEEFNNKFNKIEKDFNLTIEKCHNLIKYYGIEENDAKYKNIELFFKLILNYLNQIENLYKKEENEKVFKRKYEIGQKVDKKIGLNIIEQLKQKMNK